MTKFVYSVVCPFCNTVHHRTGPYLNTICACGGKHYSRNDEWINRKTGEHVDGGGVSMRNLNLSVCVMHDDKSWELLYEYIPTWEEADLIAQYAMAMRTSERDLIFIFPGNNRGINKDPELWVRAVKLAQKYVREK